MQAFGLDLFAGAPADLLGQAFDRGVAQPIQRECIKRIIAKQMIDGIFQFRTDRADCCNQALRAAELLCNQRTGQHRAAIQQDTSVAMLADHNFSGLSNLPNKPHSIGEGTFCCCMK